MDDYFCTICKCTTCQELIQTLHQNLQQELSLARDTIQYKQDQINLAFDQLETTRQQLEEANRAIKESHFATINDLKQQCDGRVEEFKKKYNVMYIQYKDTKDLLDATQIEFFQARKEWERISQKPPIIIEPPTPPPSPKKVIVPLVKENVEDIKLQKQVRVLEAQIVSLTAQVEEGKQFVNNVQRSHRRKVEEYELKMVDLNDKIVLLRQEASEEQKRKEQEKLERHGVESRIKELESENNLLQRNLRVWKEKYEKKFPRH